MRRKNYQQPRLYLIELSSEQMIATSGDAGGTIDKMPWGSNKRTENSPIW